MTLRQLLRGIEVPDREDITLRRMFGWGGRALFFAVMFALILAASVVDGYLAGALIGAALAQFFYILLPLTDFRETANALLSGKAGEEAYDDLEEQTDETTSRLRGWFR